MTRHSHPQHPLRHKKKHGHRRKRERHAFTLVELVIAIGVVGAVSAASIALIGPKNILVATYNVQRQTYARQLQNAFQAYQLDHNAIPKQQTISTDPLNPTAICKEAIGTRDSSCYPIGSFSLSEYISLKNLNDPAEPCRSYSGYGLYKDPTERIIVTISNLGHGAGEGLPLDHCLADTLAPDILNINMINVTGDEATITFFTDEPAYVQVLYGNSREYDNNTAFTETLSLSHSVVIRGLTQSTTYYIRVRAIDPAGNLYAVDAGGSFTTLDTTPPYISAVIPSGLSYNAAYITWNTDEPATSQVEYGKTLAYEKVTPLNETLHLAHLMPLTGLKGSTLYHYRVLSRDSAGNMGMSDDATFTTLVDTVPPILSNITSVSTNGISATITWDTDEDANSQVEYGSTTAYGLVVPSAPTSVYGTGHSITINGLSPNQLYHFRVISSDESDNAAQSGDFSFTTNDNTSPSIVSGPNSVTANLTGTSALISWTMDELTTAQVKWGTTSGNYTSQTPVNGSFVEEHSIQMLGLVPQTTYYYIVLSRDAAGNLTTSPEYSFATRDSVPPVISNISAVSTDGTSATITWTTDENADSQIDYGITASYGPRQPFIPADPQGVTTHTIVLSSLTVNTLYHYRIRTADALGNMALSNDLTFTTVDVVAPVITGGPVITQNTGTSAVITWTTDEPSTTQILYGFTTAYSNATTFSGAYVTTHSQKLINLTPSATYNYQLKSRDSAGNVLSSTNYTFSAKSFFPVISTVTASGAATTQWKTLITWTTDVPSTSQVVYSTDLSFSSQTALDSAYVTSHAMWVTGLTVGTTYNFRVLSRESHGYQSASTTATFSTVTPPFPNLIYYWKFDETSGTVASDSGGNAQNGALVSGTSIDTSLPPTTSALPNVRSISFNGTTNYASFGNLSNTIFSTSQPTTIMLWAYVPATPSGWRAVVTRGTYGGFNTWYLGINGNNQWQFNSYGGAMLYGNLTPGAWQHVAVTQDASLRKIYVNGTLRASGTSYNVVNSIDPVLGGAVTGSPSSFAGKIDDLRFYNKVLSQAEIQAAAASNVAIDVTPPVISSPAVVNITNSSATVQWSTSEQTLDKVDYGPTTSYGLTVNTITSYQANHSVPLITGLSPATTYYYRITSRDAAENVSTYTGSFTTLNPVVAGMIGQWQLDEPSASVALDNGPYALNGAKANSPGNSASIRAPIASGNVKSMQLNGTTHSMATPDLRPYIRDDSISFSIWFYPTTAGVIVQENGDPNYWRNSQLEVSPAGVVKARVWNLTPITLGGANFNNWNHAIVRYDKTASRLDGFLNSVKSAPLNGVSRATPWTNGTTTFYFAIGQYAASSMGTSSFFGGYLDEFRVYNYAIDDATAAGLAARTGNWDTDAPVITVGPSVVATANAATITWTTDEPSTDRVKYGSGGLINLWAISGANLISSHSVSLSSLRPATSYQYTITQRDGVGNTATYGPYSFATSGDFVAPIYSATGVLVDTAGTTATVTWNTSEIANSQVEYGLTPSYGTFSPASPDPALVFSRSLPIAVTPGNTYHFRLKSADASTNMTPSRGWIFDTIPPTITVPSSASNITGTSCIINWSTSERSDTKVEYGLTTAYGYSVINSTQVANPHSIAIFSNLSPNNTYHYRVTSKDRFGNTVVGPDATFSTDVTAPSIQTGPTSSLAGQNSVAITWTTNEASDSQVEYGPTTAYGSFYPTVPADATGVTSHSVTVLGIVPAQQYHYRVKTKDLAGNLTISGDGVFTISDTAEPILSATTVSAITGTSALVTWTTNEVADSQVEYGLTTSYGTQTTINPIMSSGHSIFLTGLTPNTQYFLRARSQDTASNLGLSTGSSFTTLDTQPPIFSSVVATILTDTSVRITWTTNKASTSQIQYDPTSAVPPYEFSNTVDAALVTSHSQTLTGLTSNTTYHFRVKSVDGAANIGYSTDFVFTTPDTTAPIISSIVSRNVSDSSQSVSWVTNETADSQVEYGTTTNYGTSTTLDSSLQVNHLQTITGLQGNTEYHYRIKSRDSAGNLTTTTDRTFLTSDSTPPQFFSINVGSITASTAVITWLTDELSDSQVEYGLTSALGLSTTLPTTSVTNHSMNLSNLTGSTLYYFRVRSTDLAQNTGVSTQTYTFTTQADITPPAVFSLVSGPLTDTTAIISWDTNENADSQVEYGPTTAYGTSTTLPTAYTAGHSVTIVGLAPNTTYQYRVKSKDITGNLGMSNNRSFTTPDTTSPVFLTVDSVTTAPTLATVTWTTNEISNSQIEWGVTTAYGNTTALDSNLVTTHTQTVTVPQPNSLYQFRVRSRDASGNLGISPNYILDFVPPVISAVAPLTITGTGARLVFSTDEPATSQIEYGLTNAYGLTTILDPALVTAHVVAVSPLSELTTYHYRIKTSDKSGNQNISIDYDFTTINAPPIINSVSASPIGQTNAAISWSTNEQTDAMVEYGLTTAYGSSTALNATLSIDHSELLTPLTPNTLYHYRVVSKDANGGQTVSEDQTFTTLP
ncbi:MAG: fibronectin type III domain-containing protein [Candidatus Peribacteraceae bacterium]|nr:fibronectin type III domain-containing protein [Candidatus Peribacteraceae bacterium]